MRSGASSAASAAFRARQSAFSGRRCCCAWPSARWASTRRTLRTRASPCSRPWARGCCIRTGASFFGTGKDGLGWLLLETVGIALAGTGLGALLAAPLAFLSTPKLLPRPAALLFRVLIVAIRSVPFLIYGLIFIRVSGPGAFTGVLTLAVCSIGLLSKRFTEAIEALDFRAYDALRAMGVSLLPRIRYAVLPQLAPALASAVLYRFDVNIREASVLGLVGAGGIGAPLIFAMNQYAWSDVSAIFLGFVLLVWGIDVGSARLRHRRSTAAASE